MFFRFSFHRSLFAVGLSAALAFGGFAREAPAQVYDNGSPVHTSAALKITQWVQADDLSVYDGARLQSIKFWTLETLADFQGSFTWEIFANSSAKVPGALLFSGTSANLNRTTTGIDVYGYLEVINTFDLPSVNLPPGVYWLALHNGPFSIDTNKMVFWETTDANATMTSEADQTPFHGAWSSNDCPECSFNPPEEFAFQLFGVAGPRVTAVNSSNHTPRISFTTIAGQNYRVEYNNLPNGTGWAPVAGAENIAGTGGPLQVTDSDPNIGNVRRRFYRVVLL